MNLEQFTRAYITAALWSSSDDEGEPLSNQHDADDIAPETLATMRADCEAFITAHADLLARYAKWRDYQEWTASELAGHDFWLTRNRHGAGFWDRGLPEDLGTALTEAAHACGEVDLIIGDDGMIY
jgi:hypothetical protein